ncbi:MAG: Hsp20/alpha crystallin family protein [Pseudomonadota bacterium]
MTLMKYEPWNAMSSLHNELDRIFNARRSALHDTDATVADWAPAVDIFEDGDRYVLRADVPGVDASAIEVTMNDGALTLSGERKEEREVENERYRRVERATGRFLRRFTLPETADAEGITASSANGVLEVVIPKVAKVQSRRIDVKVS